jgi:hypothetical protein
MARTERDDPFFIGWAETPPNDRRFFIRLGLGLMAGTVGLGAGLAALQRAPGSGGWDPDKVHEWRGIVSAAPYAMLRSRDLGGDEPRTALLSCLGKCGVAAQIGALEGQPVVVTGSLIQRGPHSMIAVDEQGPWLRRDERAAPDAGLAVPAIEALGEVSLSGEILDSKCWFGAMRPSDGKLHKACASLCIRGGIPPAFFARGPAGQTALMIMTDAGRAHGPELLALVADPVHLSGRVFRRGDLLMLDTPVSAIRRL